MSELILENIIIVWLAIGVVCITLEAMAIPGVGFLFAGLSAITIGGLLSFEVIDTANILTQLALFFGLTFAWAVVLWVPLKNFSMKNEAEGYNNMVGDIAIVESDLLTKDKTGKVKWSGTIMKARLDADDEKDSVAKGEEVYIKVVDGNVMTVTTTKPKAEASAAQNVVSDEIAKSDSEGDG